MIVHGSVEIAKRHRFAQLTSRRNPVRARDGPRPPQHLFIGMHVSTVDESRDALSGHLVFLFTLLYAASVFLFIYFSFYFLLRLQYEQRWGGMGGTARLPRAGLATV